MRKTLLGALILAAVTAAPLIPAPGDEREDWRYHRQEPRGGYGDRRYDGSPAVSQTIRDLERIGARAFVDRHESRHFERALNELYAFQYRARDGRFDRGRLDRAIDNIRDLAGARQLHPRDRELLRRDLYELRQFRSGRGYARGPYGW